MQRPISAAAPAANRATPGSETAARPGAIRPRSRRGCGPMPDRSIAEVGADVVARRVRLEETQSP
jgi:hypothetical protein